MSAPHTAIEHNDGEVHAHISSWQLYLGILFALMLLTALTVGFSFIHLGTLNLAVAVLIATIKASLVVTYFMHLKHDNRFNALVFLGSIFFVAIFLIYTFNDTAHRAKVDPFNGAIRSPETGELAPGRGL